MSLDLENGILDSANMPKKVPWNGRGSLSWLLGLAADHGRSRLL